MVWLGIVTAVAAVSAINLSFTSMVVPALTDTVPAPVFVKATAAKSTLKKPYGDIVPSTPPISKTPFPLTCMFAPYRIVQIELSGIVTTASVSIVIGPALRELHPTVMA